VGGAYGPGARLIEHDRPGRVALRTVQGVLERVVREVVRERVELVGASRTDSGVHARGQVCAFTSVPDGKGTGWPLARGPERLVMALNARLDEDVVVRSAGVVEGGFDPIGGAVRKRYTYTIWAGRRRPLWDRRYVWWLSRGGLDVAKMHDAAQALVGEHDFASFAAPGHGRLSTVRRVFVCGVREVRGEGDGEGGDGQRVVMTIEGNGFLWNMVRIIAGSLVEVGLGQRPVAWVGGSLEARDRLKAGPTAPPTGLCLERVWYAGEGA
jgi:tRNA pseudouridine38-40 synthase